MLNLAKRFNHVFLFNPFQFVEFLDELDALKGKLSKLALMSTCHPTFDDIVIFFSYTSEWHDKGLKKDIELLEHANFGQFTKLISELNRLQSLINDSGRCEHGWNRTNPGQLVTPDNVYLGNILGILTHPVSYWSGLKKEPENMWGRDLEHNPIYVQELILEQAKTFIYKNSSVICKQIELIGRLYRDYADQKIHF